MEKQYIVSERAHFMCPNMHFGILERINAVFCWEKVNEALEIMSVAHPFLRSIVKYEEDKTRLFYNVTNTSKIYIKLCKTEDELWGFYKAIGKKPWNVFENGLLKVCVCPMQESFQIIFIAHHLLGDGRCILELAQEFADIYCDNKLVEVVEEQLIKSIDELPCDNELSVFSRILVKLLNKQWLKENHSVTYEEYCSFSKQFSLHNPVAIMCQRVDENCVQVMKQLCKEHNISINDLLMARTYLSTNSQKIIIAADIRNKVRCYQKGAVGNYASAMSIVCKNAERDVVKKAKIINKLVKTSLTNNKKLMMILVCYFNMEPTLIDAAAIAGLGGFESRAAKFVGRNMFGFFRREGISITNLGSISNSHILEAMFIPPASPAMKLTYGILTVNNKMNICCSYYQNQTSDQEIRKHLKALADN